MLNSQEAHFRYRKMADEYLAGNTCKVVAHRFGVSVGSVQVALRRFGIKGRQENRTVAIKHDAFDSLSDEARYWIGFLLADGCVQSVAHGNRHNALFVNLAARDRGHLESLCKFLGSGAPIIDYMANGYGKSSPGCGIRVYSRKLVDSLVSFGVCPRKTHTAAVQRRFINDAHFWRGVIDGDGCLSWWKNRFIISLVGTHDVCRAFGEFVGNALDVKVRRPQFKSGDSLFQIQYSSNVARRLAEMLYVGEPFLERKMELVRQARMTPLPKVGRPQTTHCWNGHPFDEQNTYIAPSGMRQCRTCKWQRRHRNS